MIRPSTFTMVALVTLITVSLSFAQDDDARWRAGVTKYRLTWHDSKDAVPEILHRSTILYDTRKDAETAATDLSHARRNIRDVHIIPETRRPAIKGRILRLPIILADNLT